MVMTTVAAELPGVTGAEGLNRHCARAGNEEQLSVTAELNEEPTGWMVRLNGPLVWPAFTVWLHGVGEQPRAKPCPTLSDSGGLSVWLGCPEESATVRLMLYDPGAVSFGTFRAMVNVIGVFALIGMGFVGVIVHWAAAMALASQLAFIDPL